MRTVILSIGNLGSGKTSVLKKLARQNSFLYIAPDEIKFERLGRHDDHSIDREVWYEAREKVRDALKEGKTVVFDSTFRKKRWREHFITFARNAGATNLEAIYFDIPLEIVLKRNAARGAAGDKLAPEAVIREASEDLRSEPPKAEEGFDTLLRMDAEGKISTLSSLPESVLIKFLQVV